MPSPGYECRVVIANFDRQIAPDAIVRAEDKYDAHLAEICNEVRVLREAEGAARRVGASQASPLPSDAGARLAAIEAERDRIANSPKIALFRDDSGPEIEPITGFTSMAQAEALGRQLQSKALGHKASSQLFGLRGEAVVVCKHDPYSPCDYEIYTLNGTRLNRNGSMHEVGLDANERLTFPGLPNRERMMSEGVYYQPESDRLHTARELIWSFQKDYASENPPGTRPLSIPETFDAVEHSVHHGGLVPVSREHAQEIRARGYGRGDHPCIGQDDINHAFGRKQTYDNEQTLSL